MDFAMDPSADRAVASHTTETPWRIHTSLFKGSCFMVEFRQ
jgi:hypothetical protein